AAKMIHFFFAGDRGFLPEAAGSIKRLFSSDRGALPPHPSVQILWGLPAPTPREYRELRAPVPRRSDLVGATSPHAPGVSGATRPRTPRFTFGRPNVNRKTAKTHGFGFLCLNRSLSDLGHLRPESDF